MIISSAEFQSVLVDVMKFISDGKLPESAQLQFQNTQNLVADEIGMSYQTNAGLFDIFDFCEKNNIDNDSVQRLFSALKNNNANIKRLYELK